MGCAMTELQAAMTVAAEPPTGDGDGATLALVEERLDVSVQTVETGRVRITTRVVTEPSEQHVALSRTQLRVERIDVDRVEDAPPLPRQTDGVTVIPIFEEILVVRYRVTGEVHVTEETSTEDQIVREPLRRTTVDIERLPPDGFSRD
jgi:uncharacterized protein (TIGR02271 family)